MAEMACMYGYTQSVQCSRLQCVLTFICQIAFRLRFNPGTERPIPFIGTNADFDIMNWTQRFIEGLDFPILHEMIAVGGCDQQLMGQLAGLRERHPDLNVFHASNPMGNLSVGFHSSYVKLPFRRPLMHSCLFLSNQAVQRDGITSSST